MALPLDLTSMAEMEFNQRLSAVRETFSAIVDVLNPEKLSQERDELEAAVAEPGLWDDQARAQRLTSKLSRAKQSLETIQEVESRLSDAEVLFQMAQEEGDDSSGAEAMRELQVLEKDPLLKV